MCLFVFFFQAEDGIRDAQESRGLGDVYKRQASSSKPCTVPSSPYGPCSTGKTTSTGPGSGTPVVSDTKPGRVGSADSATVAPPGSTAGSSRPDRASALGSSGTSTQRPGSVMPTGTTSYRSGSSASQTLPAEMQAVSYTHLRAHATPEHLVCRILL